MKRLKYALPRKALEKLLISRIRHIIECGNFIYDNSLEQIQREAARICTGAMLQTSADKILTEVGWERLECRRSLNGKKI